VACLVAGFVRGYSGFGFSALLIAASSLVTNPLNFVAVVVILETVMSLQAAKGGWAGCGLEARRMAAGRGGDRPAGGAVDSDRGQRGYGTGGGLRLCPSDVRGASGWLAASR
jgi:hypothetical protein